MFGLEKQDEEDNQVRDEDFLSQKDLRDQMDAEVKRVSGLFRFILKYQRHFQPSGVEFSGLRQYLPSDDASRIDWKNSAGKPELYVKQYEEELNMDVYIILDVSDTMIFGTADKLKSEYAATVAAALTFASVDAGIDVGLGMYAEEESILTPAGGNDRYQRVLDEVTDMDRYGGRFNLENALNDAIGQIKENTALFVISDFLEVDGDWKSKMTLCNKKFRHVMSIMARDLRDYKMPESGNIRFESASGGGEMVVNTDRIKQKFDKKAEEQMEKMENKIEEGGSSFMKLDTRDSFSAKFAEFFEEDEGGW